MSGFEVVGVILAAVPYVLTGFSEIRQFLRDYTQLDHKIRIALNAFDKEMDVFRMVWNEIQCVDSGPNEVGRWLLDNVDLTHHPALVSSLQAMKPERLKVMSGALEESQTIVTNVYEILTKLRDVCRRDTKPSPLFSPVGITSQPSMSIFETAKDRLSPRRLLARAMRREVLEQLKQSTLMMCSCNTKLNYAVVCGKAEPKMISPLIQGEVVSHHVVMRARQDAAAMGIASTKVYEITLKSPLHCKCHLVHLRLDTQSIRALTAAATGQQPSEGTKIFFRLIDEPKCHAKQTSSHPDGPGLQFFFTDSSTTTTSTPAHNLPSICAGLVNFDAGYERFFRDNGGNGNTGFLLRHTPSEGTPTNDSERISFDQLVTVRSNQLLHRDILHIAANLAHSVLRFYSSTWAQDWTPRKIQFFQHYGQSDKYEQPSFTSYLWTPHLFLPSSSLNSGTPMTTGEVIYELGVMLLELGRRFPLNLDGLSQWDRQMTIKGALGDVSQRMGVRYGDIVDRYMNIWSVGDVDLMREGILSIFLSDILLLETLANNFPQTKYTSLVPGVAVVG
ncbi:hypothetical protein Q9L58_006974 [Maublancomyces gigas]|uniref:DUF7580 domain-containing protein n=1 Tax=Discina gigas TaxID=1032678 RepID=A0ABR3GDX1_9PEZI